MTMDIQNAILIGPYDHYVFCRKLIDGNILGTS